MHEPRSDKVDKYTITMILTEESAHEFYHIRKADFTCINMHGCVILGS